MFRQPFVSDKPLMIYMMGLGLGLGLGKDTTNLGTLRETNDPTCCIGLSRRTSYTMNPSAPAKISTNFALKMKW